MKKDLFSFIRAQHVLVDPEATANLYCKIGYLYLEECVICNIYFLTSGSPSITRTNCPMSIGEKQLAKKIQVDIQKIRLTYHKNLYQTYKNMQTFKIDGQKV